MKRITAIYVRVSSREQALQGYSLDAQELKCRQYADLMGYDTENLVLYKDDGFSAKSLNRPRMQDLIKGIKDGKIVRVIVYKLDRLTRSVTDVYQLMQMFMDFDCELKAIVDSLDLTSANGRMLVGMLSIIAQWEREVISERTKDGLAEKVNQGKYPYGGRAPFGWDKQKDGKLCINEEQTSIKNAAADWILEGYSLSRVCELVQEHYGYKPTFDSLKRYMEDEKNIGILVYNGERKVDFVPALMDDNKFQEVQYYLSFRAHRAPFKSRYIFHSLVYCTKCGSRLDQRSTVKKQGAERKRYFYYSCPNCSKRISQKILIEQTFFDVAKALADWRQTERMKRVEISLNAINKKIQDLEQAYMDDEFDAKSYMKARQPLDKNVEDLEKQIRIFDVKDIDAFYALDYKDQYLIMDLVVSKVEVDLEKKRVVTLKFKSND